MKYHTKNKRQLSFTLAEEEIKALNSLAKQENRNRSNTIGWLILKETQK
ncbi:hypothetical protein HY500_01380 [Candidatus Woesearchaeota archaeon]|nr:hypothetical protein [Candidatus Woesearchaeota archaeon]